MCVFIVEMLQLSVYDGEPLRPLRGHHRGPVGPIDRGLPTRSRCNTRRVSSEASMLSTGLFSGRSIPLSGEAKMADAAKEQPPLKGGGCQL